MLAESVTTARRTTGSNLDIIVLLPDGDRRAPHRGSRYFHDWSVELFVYDERSFVHHLAKELPSRLTDLAAVEAKAAAGGLLKSVRETLSASRTG